MSTHHPQSYGISFRFLAACGLIPPLIDAMIVTLIGALHPDYSPVRDFISELGETGRRYSSLVSLWWCLLTFLYLPFAMALKQTLPTHPAKWLLLLAIVAYSVLTGFGSWLFPCDPGCKGETFSAQMHFLLNYLGMLAMVMAPLFLWLILRHSWSRFARFSLLMHIALVVSLTLMAYVYYGNGPPAVTLKNSQGLLQRIFLGSYYLWSGAMAIALWTNGPHSLSTPESSK